MTSSYQMFLGLDIGYRTFTLATLKVEAKAEAAPAPLPPLNLVWLLDNQYHI